MLKLLHAVALVVLTANAHFHDDSLIRAPIPPPARRLQYVAVDHDLNDTFMDAVDGDEEYFINDEEWDLDKVYDAGHANFIKKKDQAFLRGAVRQPRYAPVLENEDMMDEDMIDDYMMDEDLIDEDMMDEDLIDEDMMDDYMMDEDMIDDYYLDTPQFVQGERRRLAPMPPRPPKRSSSGGKKSSSGSSASKSAKKKTSNSSDRSVKSRNSSSKRSSESSRSPRESPRTKEHRSFSEEELLPVMRSDSDSSFLHQNSIDDGFALGRFNSHDSIGSAVERPLPGFERWESMDNLQRLQSLERRPLAPRNSLELGRGDSSDYTLHLQSLEQKPPGRWMDSILPEGYVPRFDSMDSIASIKSIRAPARQNSLASQNSVTKPVRVTARDASRRSRSRRAPARQNSLA